MISTKEYIELYNKHPDPLDTDSNYEGEQEDFDKIVEYNKALLAKYPWLTPRNAWSGKKITDCSGEEGEEGFWPGSPTSHPDYHYEYTIMDDMPDGWRLAFGDQMLEELQAELEKFDYVDEYTILQIKEKYGTLRWYTNGTPIGLLAPADKEFIGTWDEKPREYDHSKEVWVSEPLDPYPEDMELKDIIKDETPRRYKFQHKKILEPCMLDEIVDKYEALSWDTCIKCGKPAVWRSRGWISPWCDACKNEIGDYETFSPKDEE